MRIMASAPSRNEFPNGGAAVPVTLNGRSLPTTDRDG
jgi:hypothetical protein